MTPLERDSLLLHQDAMKSKDYAKTHMLGHAGPGHMSITAQWCAKRGKDKPSTIFTKQWYYSVRSPMGIDIARHETREDIIAIETIDIKPSNFDKYLKDGVIRLVGEDVIEYELINDDETLTFIRDRQMIDRFGVSADEDIKQAERLCEKFGTYDVYKRYIEVDQNGDFVRRL